ncbi:MAG TPA: glycosyltransferase family 39 protein [Candidatus Binatus sp.]|nr:glycosyltransferase family 39 protein [Candidatus Binatus sp.]
MFGLLLVVLFFGLGKAQLFEPDEGRNAEIAREILVSGDWVTPHNDFLPALDKPMAFFWLVAIAYKIFGISEWSARLPSALAALGCFVLIYKFTRQLWGVREALWSLLVWTTSVEVFFLARVVIFDMALTLCITLALMAFYMALHSENDAARKRICCLMYVAMGMGSLIKGPIALFIPALTIGVYLLLTKRLGFLRRMSLFTGALIFFPMVTPWYLWAEARNPGYIKYFLWEEHVLRFLTPHFGRTEPWYYFLPVLAIGFLPWSLVLPAVIRDSRFDWRDERKLFLLLWIILPFTFFSLSSAKLPHYILPIFPPLAMLTGVAMQRYTAGAVGKTKWTLLLPWFVQFVLVLYLCVGAWRPEIFPEAIRADAAKMASLLSDFKFVLSAIVASAFYLGLHFYRKPLAPIPFGIYAVLMILFPLFMVEIMAGASRSRSAKGLADESRRFVVQGSRLAVYDTYLCGLPFYLRVSEPISIVWSGTKSNIMGSWYVAENQPRSMRGKVLFTFNEFDEMWRITDQRLLVYVKDKNLSRLSENQSTPARQLLNLDGYVLATNH